MQVAVAFTQTGTSITVTMPPNANVAPPGNYQLFVTTTQGCPSQGVYIGLGGATPAPGPFTDAPRPPVLADGTYTITARGRVSCPASLSYNTCSQSNDAIMGTGGKSSGPQAILVQVNYPICTVSRFCVLCLSLTLYLSCRHNLPSKTSLQRPLMLRMRNDCLSPEVKFSRVLLPQEP